MNRASMITASDEFRWFLLAAKRATYAGQGDAASVAPLLPDSKQLQYAQGGFLYRDIYVGMLHFVGQELVYCEGCAIWSLAYSGGLLPVVPKAEARHVYAGLRAALAATPMDAPLRGPAAFDAGDLRYTSVVHGDLQRFRGEESIARQGRPLFELHFCGGSLA